NGKVLITGGANFNVATGYVRSAELYDPATGRFSAAGDFAAGRRFHTATLLQNGKVLIAGGFGSLSSTNTDYVALAELYDSTSGDVFIAGGYNPYSYFGVLASAELYDPLAGSFSAIGSLGTARQAHTATLLQNGKVLITAGGGRGPGFLASSELYDPLYVSV